MDPVESDAGRKMYLVAGWEFGPVPNNDFVALRMHVRKKPLEEPDHVEMMEILVMRPDHAMALSVAIAQKVRELTTPPTGSTH